MKVKMCTCLEATMMMVSTQCRDAIGYAERPITTRKGVGCMFFFFLEHAVVAAVAFTP